MKWKIRLYLATLASFIEIFVAILLALALIICSVQLIIPIFSLQVSVEEIDVFHNYLESLFVLVIGIEALKMLCKHSPGSVLEVVLFSIAREMIVVKTTPVENMMAVVSIGMIFAIRKYLFVPSFGSEEHANPFATLRDLHRSPTMSPLTEEVLGSMMDDEALFAAQRAKLYAEQKAPEPEGESAAAPVG